MYVRACINTRFLCIRGELQGVHTLGSLYLRNSLLLFVKKLNSDAKEPKTLYVNLETARTNKASWVFHWTYVE